MTHPYQHKDCTVFFDLFCSIGDMGIIVADDWGAMEQRRGET